MTKRKVRYGTNVHLVIAGVCIVATIAATIASIPAWLFFIGLFLCKLPIDIFRNMWYNRHAEAARASALSHLTLLPHFIIPQNCALVNSQNAQKWIHRFVQNDEQVFLDF